MVKRTCGLCSLLALLLALPGRVAAIEQRPGVVGQFGQSLTLGRDYPLAITVKSLELSPVRTIMAGTTYVPAQGEKLLVLHFTVQNPTKTERLLEATAFRFTLVDAEQANFENIEQFGLEGKGEGVSLLLKPAQTVAVFTLFMVPAKAVLPKLMALPADDDDPVIRYDLTGKIARLPAPYADPADQSGLTPVAELKGESGKWLPAGPFDLRLDKLAVYPDKLADTELEDGAKLWCAACTVRNQGAAEENLVASAFLAKLTLKDGGEARWDDRLYAKAAARDIEQMLKPGAELAVRFFFVVPPDAQPEKLAIHATSLNGDGARHSRDLVYAVAPATTP